MEKCENHSAAQGWSGSIAMEMDPGLKAEASSKASFLLTSSLSKPCLFSPPLLHSPSGGEIFDGDKNAWVVHTL